MNFREIAKNCILSLKNRKKCNIVVDTESKLKQMCVLPSTLITNQESGGEAMLEIFMFLVIGLIISITINLALLCIIYIQWVNSQIK